MLLRVLWLPGSRHLEFPGEFHICVTLSQSDQRHKLNRLQDYTSNVVSSAPALGRARSGAAETAWRPAARGPYGSIRACREPTRLRRAGRTRRGRRAHEKIVRRPAPPAEHLGRPQSRAPQATPPFAAVARRRAAAEPTGEELGAL